MSNKDKTSKVTVPVTFKNFVNKYLKEQVRNAIQKDLSEKGLGTLGSPDLRNTTQRMKTKKRVIKEVISKFKQKNPSAVKRMNALKKIKD